MTNRLLTVIIFLGLTTTTNIFGQTKIHNPDHFLVGNRKLPTVLCVGTFHFAYQNLDVYKTAKDKQIDILSPKRQIEVEKLVNYISKYKPTKIVIEREPGDTTMINRYKSFTGVR